MIHSGQTGKQLVTQKLKQILSDLKFEDVEPTLSIPENSKNGDYSTNVAMRLAGVLKKKPLDIAYEIKDAFEKLNNGSLVSKVEVAPPGFINFFFTDSGLIETARAVSAHENYGDSDSFKDKKIMIEFTDPNPFKEFHIGHLYSNIVGESLSRLHESQGATVRRVCYQGDVGLHVAKAIYGMIKAGSIPDDEASLSVRAAFMGKAYSLGASAYEDNKKIKEEINVINKKIYDATDENINELYEKGRAWSLEYFDAIYERLGTKFTRFYFESEASPVGIALVREFLAKGVFEESDGAVIFPGKKHGLHNRVFINSLGLPTYEAKEMGLAPTKYKDFEYDESIIITANEVDEYFRVVLKALEMINPDLAHKTRHISHGIVKLPSGKMSSRTGSVITGEWLMDEAVARITKAYPEMDGATAEKVGLAAIKFALLKSAVGHDIEFNFDESISLTGASGPYLQYAYVRTQSVIAKNKSAAKNKNSAGDKNLNNEEKEVLRTLVYFPEIVTQATNKLSPNLIASYLLDLSQKFNLFYQKHKIADDASRLELTAAVGVVLKHGLNLLGIETVESM